MPETTQNQFSRDMFPQIPSWRSDKTRSPGRILHALPYKEKPNEYRLFKLYRKNLLERMVLTNANKGMREIWLRARERDPRKAGKRQIVLVNYGIASW